MHFCIYLSAYSFLHYIPDLYPQNYLFLILKLLLILTASVLVEYVCFVYKFILFLTVFKGNI